jgi:hypothetical protein
MAVFDVLQTGPYDEHLDIQVMTNFNQHTFWFRCVEDQKQAIFIICSFT